MWRRYGSNSMAQHAIQRVTQSTYCKLQATLGDDVISQNGLVNWLPRSCDLKTNELFFVGICEVVSLLRQTIDAG